jgi:hypothetical protein
MTIGEDRVRIKFNPSASNLVDDIKQRTAKLIDMCDEQSRVMKVPTRSSVEAGRLWALAMTHYETAAMYAVKAATAEE